MRRKDREMDKRFAFAVIDKSTYGVVSMVKNNNEPYAIPLSIVREKDVLYFHSAGKGEKVDIFMSTPDVIVTFVGQVKVPDIFSLKELNMMADSQEKASLIINQVFTTEYESAIVSGKIELIKNEAEKIKALKLICEKYTPDKMAYSTLAIKAGLKRTNVYKIPISKITAKRKKYDENGEEMKWGRMN